MWLGGAWGPLVPPLASGPHGPHEAGSCASWASPMGAPYRESLPASHLSAGSPAESRGPQAESGPVHPQCPDLLPGVGTWASVSLAAQWSTCPQGCQRCLPPPSSGSLHPQQGSSWGVGEEGGTFKELLVFQSRQVGDLSSLLPKKPLLPTAPPTPVFLFWVWGREGASFPHHRETVEAQGPLGTGKNGEPPTLRETFPSMVPPAGSDAGNGGVTPPTPRKVPRPKSTHPFFLPQYGGPAG